MMTVNGHLIFQTGTNHNITFKSLGGGYVNIDGENVQRLATMVTQKRGWVDRWSSSPSSPSLTTYPPSGYPPYPHLVYPPPTTPLFPLSSTPLLLTLSNPEKSFLSVERLANLTESWYSGVGGSGWWSYSKNTCKLDGECSKNHQTNADF